MGKCTYYSESFVERPKMIFFGDGSKPNCSDPNTNRRSGEVLGLGVLDGLGL